MLKGLFSTDELFNQMFGVVEGEEIVKEFGKTCFNIGFELGYNTRKEEVRETRNK